MLARNGGSRGQPARTSKRIVHISQTQLFHGFYCELWVDVALGAGNIQVFMFFVQPLSSSIATLFHFAATSVLPFPILPCSVVDQSLRVFRSEYSFRVISEHSLECLLINLDLGIESLGFCVLLRYRKPWLTTRTLHSFI